MTLWAFLHLNGGVRAKDHEKEKREEQDNDQSGKFVKNISEIQEKGRAGREPGKLVPSGI